MKKTIIYSTAVSILALTAFFTVPTFATDNTDVVDEINITIPVSCTLTGTNLLHTDTIQNNQYKTDIGSATIKATCNDTNGLAVYAIGYTNDEYGNNQMIDSSLDSAYNIDTGKYTSGTTTNSVWSMKLTPVSGTYAPTIRNDASYNYTNYEIVPSDYTKVAYKTTATDTGTGSTGANFTTDYAVYASSTQPAGTYTGKVKFTLVHPQDAAAPEIPTPKSIATATTMQEVTICPSSLPTGTTYTLTDTRDNEEYIVAKLADDNCWMLDNLRLGGNTTMTLTPENTNISSNYTLPASGTANFSAPSGDYIITAAINADSKNTVATHYGPGTGKAGVYYNYCAATAGEHCEEDYDYESPAPHDVCPRNWRMPTEDEFGFAASLSDAYNYYYDDPSDPDSFQYNIAASLSGYFYDGSRRTFNQYGNYWTGYVDGPDLARVVLIASDNMDPYTSESFYFGFTIRCAMQNTDD